MCEALRFQESPLEGFKCWCEPTAARMGLDKDHSLRVPVSSCKFSLRITYHFIVGEIGDGPSISNVCVFEAGFVPGLPAVSLFCMLKS